MKYKIKFASVFLSLWLLWGVSTQAQTYNTLWKQIENAEKKGQPKTAKTIAEKIYRKAEAEGNFPWLVKSYAQLTYLNTDISTDSFKINIEHVEKMLNGREGTCDAAVLHTILGSAYNDMKNRFRNDADTYEKYQYLSDQHYIKAMEDKEVLANAQAKDYVPLVTLHPDSKLFGNDMLSVIAMFIAQNRNFDNDRLYFMYDTLSTFYAEKGNRNASLLMKLKALDKQRYAKDRKLRIDEDTYKNILLKMANENKDIEVGADIYFKLLSNWYGGEREKLDIARQAISLYPNSVYATQFKLKEAEMLLPQLHVYSDGGYAVGTPFPIYVTNKNIANSVLTLIDKKTGKVVEKRMLKHTKSIESQTDTVYMTVPKAGKYIFKAESNGKSDKCEINATSLRLFATILPDQTLQCTVADNITGRPVSDCNVQAEYWDNQNKKSQVKEGRTDSLGTVNLGKNNWRTVCANRNSNDCTETAYIGYFKGTENEKEQTKLSVEVFTDRSIYRPGQSVKVMVLAYEKYGDIFNVVTQKEISLTLHDANGEEISSKTVTSNDMGTADTDFIIPQGRLNGSFFITTNNGGICYFKVEEYKRPTFNVEMSIERHDDSQEENKEYSFGDSLKIKGSAMTFSGIEVQNAKVKYTVEYNNRFFWYRLSRNWQMDFEGELTTDDNGCFIIPVVLDGNKLENDNYLLEYRITAQVTDMGGETQTAEYILPVSKKGFALSANIPQDIDKNSIPELKVTATNSRGKDINIEGKWKLYHIHNKTESERAEETAMYNYEQTLVDEGCFISGQPIECTKMKSLTPGSYVMKMSATDKHQNNIETEAEFVLFDTHAERMEVVKDWLYSSTTEFGADNSADIYFMSRHNDTYIYYYVFANEKVVEKGHRISADQIQKFHIDYRKEYGDAVTLLLFYVKNGKAYSYKKEITLKAPEKKLTLKWKTFRDKLQPGQKEEWTLCINNSEGLPSCAELMAVLYDGSLEKLNKHNWNFELDFLRKTPIVRLTHTSNNYFNALYVAYPLPKLNLKTRSFNSLEHILMYDRLYGLNNLQYSMANAGSLRKMSIMPTVAEKEEVMVEDAADMGADLEESILTKGEDVPNLTQPLRSNFAETAFFYPHLMTNDKGEVTISFTLPESLTEWKFMGLAHTEEVDYGKITAEITAYRDFMVQPNMPRFVRAGDNTSIATKIINKTGNTISGTALFELIDPETEKTVYKANKKFFVEKNGTISVEFDFNVSDKYPLLVCKISAGNKTFSDGERNYLPILTSKKYITETTPFFMDSTGTRNIDLSGMFNGGSPTATDKKMTIEYSDNPGWIVIQALESIANVNNHDAISLSSALYANYTIKEIADNNPSIHSMVDTWRNSGTSSTKSNLEKNEDLKSILLQESPWQGEAEDETEQMMKLADLFDRNIMEYRISESMEKLIRLQNADGSWSWFNGMEGNYHVTATVVEQLAQINIPAIRNVILKGCKYLDKKELDKYRHMKKEKQKIIASEATMRYLYLSSLIKRDISNEVKKMQQEYIDYIGQNINILTIYGRANIVSALNACGKKELAKDFVKSLREYTVYKTDMGRYYDTDRSVYSWMDYRIPTHIAAMKAMRMMRTEFNDTEDYLNNMTLWLIRQKQTQHWDNPINTVNAVNELLQTDKDIVMHDTSEANFIFNGKKLNETVNNITGEQSNASISPNGYKKIFVPEKAFGKKKNELTIVKNSKGISWGAIYAQYLENFDKLSDSNGSLTVSRKIYKEENINGKKEWKELPEEYVFSVGDKIRIRHIITADRDMDFIQIRSQFAACMEPLNPISGYRRLQNADFIGGNNGCYVAIHDASADFFFDTFRKGTSTVDMEMFINRKGTYSSGIATIQCAYSTEFSGYSRSNNMKVE